MAAQIGVIGSGIVGKTLAEGFLKAGHPVLLGSQDPSKRESLKAEISGPLEVGTFAQAADYGELIVFAVKGSVALPVVASLDAKLLEGKVVIDTTNPIADAPPVNGVLQFFTGPNESLMEKLQSAKPAARFVKAWNSVGSAFMIKPSFAAGRPTMFICGNDRQAKSTVCNLLIGFGWDCEDMGDVQSARALEPLCQLWCIPGLRENRWQHAFQLLKK
jgi:predicted dinucleotide-binding enzyme